MPDVTDTTLCHFSAKVELIFWLPFWDYFYLVVNTSTYIKVMAVILILVFIRDTPLKSSSTLFVTQERSFIPHIETMTSDHQSAIFYIWLILLAYYRSFTVPYLYRWPCPLRAHKNILQRHTSKTMEQNLPIWHAARCHKRMLRTLQYEPIKFTVQFSAIILVWFYCGCVLTLVALSFNMKVERMFSYFNGKPFYGTASTWVSANDLSSLVNNLNLLNKHKVT